jgi:prepilin-type N-terminal cleavage/methylation domain-containing protein
MKLTNQRGAVCSRRKGWTLVELLVAIGIVLLLASLGFPAAKRVLDNAKFTKCSSNLRQWGMGFQSYLNDHDGYFPQQAEVLGDANTQWQELIAPYLVGFSTATGKRFTMRDRFRCPNDKTTGIVYGGNTYLRPSQYSKAPPKLISLNKKLADFALMAENYTGEYWDTHPWNGNNGLDYTRHTIGGKSLANFLFADMHVEALSYDDTLKRPVITIP